MVQEQRLSSVLSEFARTLVTVFPIQGILDHLVQRIVTVLPITGAGVTLIAPGVRPRYVAASSDAALRFEMVQTDIGEGPCLLAFESGEAVSVPDLAADDRFPRFGPPAVAAGLIAVFTFPLRQDDMRLGALDLYCDSTGSMADDDMVAAQTLADVASAYLTNVQSRAESRAMTEHFRQSALHDPLTGLPNRLLLAQRLEHASQRGRRSHGKAAVLFVDLDRFKLVNDAFGHRVGDALLVAVGRRMAGLLRPGDTLARVSGDEFVVLCEDLHDSSDVELLATRIDRAFTVPFDVGGSEVSITASVGIAFAGPGEELSDQLVSDADTAMYQAKRQGGARHQIINLREATLDSQWQRMQRNLRRAILDEELDVHYQPVVRSSDGLMTGVEALLRWTHPEHGAVDPQTVVTLAEQNGLIAEIGSWVLERACRDRQDWLRQHPHQSLELAVNVSTTQLMAPGFVASVAAILQRTETDPHAVVLEITESIFIADSAHAKTVLLDLRRLGVVVALDDFGTGYCSLSYLRTFPVDVLKIDQAFVVDIGYDPVGPAFLSAVTSLAHILKLKVTAEGVENQRQRDEVAAAGCESSQGFYYSRPMPAPQLASLLQAGVNHPLHLPTPVTTEGSTVVSSDSAAATPTPAQQREPDRAI